MPNLPGWSWRHRKSWDAQWHCPPWPPKTAKATQKPNGKGPPNGNIVEVEALNSTAVSVAILNGWPRQLWSQWGCLNSESPRRLRKANYIHRNADKKSKGCHWYFISLDRGAYLHSSQSGCVRSPFLSCKNHSCYNTVFSAISVMFMRVIFFISFFGNNSKNYVWCFRWITFPTITTMTTDPGQWSCQKTATSVLPFDHGIGIHLAISIKAPGDTSSQGTALPTKIHIDHVVSSFTHYLFLGDLSIERDWRDCLRCEIWPGWFWILHAQHMTRNLFSQVDWRHVAQSAYGPKLNKCKCSPNLSVFHGWPT